MLEYWTNQNMFFFILKFSHKNINMYNVYIYVIIYLYETFLSKKQSMKPPVGV